ncbi:MAG: glycoside hydrolase family 3 N-terminal domain-containing protein [Candidatus Neomarinimicrobiota bacterium]
MIDRKAKWVDELLGKLNLAQKVGQMMAFGFAGPVITPDIIELIQKYHVGGLRITLKFRTQTLLHDIKPGTKPNQNILRSLEYPRGKNRDYADPRQCVACTPREYAAVLNQLRDYALDRELGIPIHFTIDQEGNGSDDLINGQRLFPHPMGLAASGEPELAYKVAVAIGKQARAVGANMIHSPVLDVNTNPMNPEIGTRAYSDQPEEVIKYGLETLRGFQETGLIAAGKHFPGRGESVADAHWGLPTVSLEKRLLTETHIAPYPALIAAGLPAIMSAHCCYPALGVTDVPGSTSRKVVTELLREELGFKGIITTDNMMMGGILQRFEIREAIIRAIQAGNDIILYRDESPQRIRILEAVTEAVKNGRIAESQIDESVARILGLRWDMGLVENGGKVDPELAGTPINDPFVIAAAQVAAEKSVLLLRDEANRLPLRPEQKVLLVEQVFSTHQMANNNSCHPGMLWEEMCLESPNVASVEIPMLPDEFDRERVLRRLAEAEVIVTTNYYYYKAAATMSDLVRELHQHGKPVIVISNNPFQMAAPPDFPTVITVFTAGGREHLRAAVQVLYGKLKPSASLAVRLG